MTDLVVGIDQGTSSTRCLVLDGQLSLMGTAAVPVEASFPAPGLVEQDPHDYVTSADQAMALALRAADADLSAVVAVGIANQTETFIVSECDSGRPIHPAIVWQDRRTADRCAALVSAGHGDAVRRLTGLELDATFPATKIGWVLDHVSGARRRAERGELVYHDVAGWLVHHFTGADVCEAGNAGRTLLCSLGGQAWDEGLLELFDVPRPLLPNIVDSDALARTGAGTLPVTAVLGDQQASLFGLGCHHAGMAKVTLGTGAFIWVQAGASAPEPPPGVLASCAWRRGGRASFALEGFVPAAGAVLAWFSELGALPDPRELDSLLGAAGPDDGEVVCVPALQGLGTPSWDAAARGSLFGLSRATTRGQVARAVIDGVLHQVADALEAIGGALPLTTVLLDGGMSRSDWIVSRLAEIAGLEVRRADRGEATAMGAAMLAGLAAGVWGEVDEFPLPACDLIAEPSWSADERAARRARWARAVELARAWIG